MSKIKFNLDPLNIYDGEFHQIGKNQVRLVFEDSLPNESILLSGFALINEYNGFEQTKRKDYIYLYREYEDGKTVELCNDNIAYVEPEPIPEPEPEPPYVPTEEELKAILEQNKREKILLSKTMLASYLETHPITSAVHGGVEGVYSVTSEKQTLMMSQYMTYQIEKQANPEAKLTWNETGKSCEEWTEEEFVQLILEIKAYVYPLVSYQQTLEEQISACETQEELDAIIINYDMLG